MNVLSLCAGIGGLDLGLERAGMQVIGQVEIDPFCQRVLAKHWPEVPRHDDVRTAVEWWCAEPRPPVDLIATGFPCQPVSLAGQRRGDGDERWLWPAVRDCFRVLRPGRGLLENVPGILAGWAGYVLGDLAALGYDAEWDCIPASALGAPHRRDRWWCIATDAECEPVRQQPVTEPGSDGQAVTRLDGAHRHVADADCRAVEPRGRGRRAAEVGELAHATSVGRGQGRPGRPARDGADGAAVRAEALADADRFGRDRRTEPAGPQPRGNEPPRGGHDVADSDGPRREPGGWHHGTWPAPVRDGWWAVEPDVDRVAHGVPHRVDRLRGLGNAVVPQLSEHVGRLILDSRRPA